MRAHSLQSPPDVGLLTLWRRAAADAPEIHARVRGERMHMLTEAVTSYCAKSTGALSSDDPMPRLLAGVVVGVEMAVIELWGRSGLALPRDRRGGGGGRPRPDRREAPRGVVTV